MNKKLLKITSIIIVIGIIVMSYLTFAWALAFKDLMLTAANDDVVYMTQRAEQYKIQAETPIIVEKEPQLTYLGNWKITHYCHCKICCGKDNGITATGAKVQANHTIAVDPKVIPYGSKVMINGIVYTAEDCGGGIKENRIDIYCSTHEEAKQRGVIYRDVYLINYDE